MTKSIQTIPFIVSLFFMALIAPLQAAAEKQEKAPAAWFAAAKLGNKATLEKLRSQVDVNAKNCNDWTALHESAENGHLACVQYLVQQGADIHATNGFDWTAFHKSAYYGHLAVVQWLVGQGADIQAKTKDGWTALDWARHQKHQEIVQFLEGAACISVHLKAQIDTLKATIAKLNTDHQRALQQQEVAHNEALKAQESAFQQNEEAFQTKINRLESTIVNFNTEAKARAANEKLVVTEQAMASKEAEMNMKLKLMQQEMDFKAQVFKLKEEAMVFKGIQQESQIKINTLETSIEKLKTQHKQREKDLIENFERREQELKATIKRLTQNEGVVHPGNDTPYL